MASLPAAVSEDFPNDSACVDTEPIQWKPPVHGPDSLQILPQDIINVILLWAYTRYTIALSFAHTLARMCKALYRGMLQPQLVLKFLCTDSAYLARMCIRLFTWRERYVVMPAIHMPGGGVSARTKRFGPCHGCPAVYGYGTDTEPFNDSPDDPSTVGRDAHLCKMCRTHDDHYNPHNHYHDDDGNCYHYDDNEIDILYGVGASTRPKYTTYTANTNGRTYEIIKWELHEEREYTLTDWQAVGFFTVVGNPYAAMMIRNNKFLLSLLDFVMNISPDIRRDYSGKLMRLKSEFAYSDVLSRIDYRGPARKFVHPPRTLAEVVRRTPKQKGLDFLLECALTVARYRTPDGDVELDISEDIKCIVKAIIETGPLLPIKLADTILRVGMRNDEIAQMFRAARIQFGSEEMRRRFQL